MDSATVDTAQNIDDEHLEIIRLVRDFDNLLRQGGTTEQTIDLFAVVITNIKEHFSFEEQYMREQNHGLYKEHRGDHIRLIEDLDAIMADLERGAHIGRHHRLAEWIAEWFDNHFSRFDALMLQDAC